MRQWLMLSARRASASGPVCVDETDAGEHFEYPGPTPCVCTHFRHFSRPINRWFDGDGDLTALVQRVLRLNLPR